MTQEELGEDLAYVRALAEEGRHAPLIGGGFLVLFGVLLAICYPIHWALLTGLIQSENGMGFAILWFTFGAVATVGGALLSKRIRAMPGRSAMVNRVDGVMWSGVSLALWATIIGAIGRTIIAQDPEAPNVIMAAAFGLYGAALLVTGAISEIAWMRHIARVSLAASLLLWLFLNEPWAYLLAAGASVIVLIGPGLVLMRSEPAKE